MKSDLARLVFGITACLIASTVMAVSVVPLPAGADTIERFQSPTGNTGCEYRPKSAKRSVGVLECDAVDGVAVDPSGPAGCGHQRGYRLVGPEGPEKMCTGDTLHQGPILAYGRTWSSPEFTCTSRSTGLTCVNSGGVGFFLARGEGAVVEPPDKSWAATPAAAVELITRISDRAVVRTNLAGDYAVIRTKAGSYPDAYFLAERFSFGWQDLGVFGSLCSLDARKISATDQRALMAGMTPALPGRDPKGCYDVRNADRGPADDVAAIRHLSFDEVPYAAVAGDFGYSEDYGEDGSCEYFRRVSGIWKIVAACKGAVTLDMLAPYGFTHATLCELQPGPPDAECPGRFGLRPTGG